MRPYKFLLEDVKSLISIHAPLTGCDSVSYVGYNGFDNFNPRTPYGMRRLHQAFTQIINKISIHAPLTGCDDTLEISFDADDAISIHAPLTGCDN